MKRAVRFVVSLRGYALRMLRDSRKRSNEPSPRGVHYTPLAPNAPPTTTPNANNVNLIENIERLKLPVERILPLHGRVVPVSELHATASRPMPGAMTRHRRPRNAVPTIDPHRAAAWSVGSERRARVAAIPDFEHHASRSDVAVSTKGGDPLKLISTLAFMHTQRWVGSERLLSPTDR